MIYDIAIIGAGTAGMTAALYALRANKTVLLLESTIYGGQIIQSPLVENYPGLPNVSGQDFASHLYQQLQALNQKITYQTVLDLHSHQKSTISCQNSHFGNWNHTPQA